MHDIPFDIFSSGICSIVSVLDMYKLSAPLPSQKKSKSLFFHPSSFKILCTEFSNASGPHINTKSSPCSSPLFLHFPTRSSKSFFPILPLRPVQVSGGFVKVYNKAHRCSRPLTSSFIASLQRM